MNVRTAAKTYWHLAAARRMPTAYEIVSSRLLYHAADEFSVRTPVAEWQARNGARRSLEFEDWESLNDPRATTYASYVVLQREREAFVSGLYARADLAYEAALEPSWVATLERLFAPLRYPGHALMMLASYVGSLAPSGKIAIASAFQAADETRRVHRFAERIAMLRRAHPEFAKNSRELWERDAAWQPLREVVERCLVVYDFGEAVTALNLVLKPAFDAFVNRDLAVLSERARDHVLSHCLSSFADDAAWHRDVWQSWFSAISQRDANRRRIGDWSEKWRPEVNRAIAALREISS